MDGDYERRGGRGAGGWGPQAERMTGMHKENVSRDWNMVYDR